VKEFTRRLPRPHDELEAEAPRREWLVTNGLGGYASTTIAGIVTRRYHGLLVASLPAPIGRLVMLNHLIERVRLPDRRTAWLGDELEIVGATPDSGVPHLIEFRLELGLPVWTYDVDGAVIEKRVVMPHEQNSVHVTYRLAGGSAVRLLLRPSIQFRSYEAPVTEPATETYHVNASGGRYEVSGGPELPCLRLLIHGQHAALTLDERQVLTVPYEMERRRGYEAVGSLWSPGYFRADLAPGANVTLVASTEDWETIQALGPADADNAEFERRRRLLTIGGSIVDDSFAAELVLAADQFIVTPAGRIEEAARARAAGEEVRTVIAGYHWFTDWGRDTMISLEGLTLSTHRYREASYILRTFGHYVRDGLIPNMFPDGARDGLYHTADATLWFFHAIHRYLRRTGDSELVHHLLPKLREIVQQHVNGTRFGISVDPADGLLRQGQDGYQLTWMDAKVDDWVVTPRRGKAVEINALWYNALKLLEEWTREFGGGQSERFGAHAERARTSFNERFWDEAGGYLYDVIDGEKGETDPACRPNQILAVSLDYPVLAEHRWKPVVDVVKRRLLTPFGLRTLAQGHPDYKSKYYGDLRARDAAYHQGTVWAWLIGPFVDAWLRVHPEDVDGARSMLDGFRNHLSEAAVGSISEIFDAESPYTPRGCIAQAWSVAEVLRCVERTATLVAVPVVETETHSA
jgi:predicted glycogen debranching enzyme